MGIIKTMVISSKIFQWSENFFEFSLFFFHSYQWARISMHRPHRIKSFPEQQKQDEQEFWGMRTTTRYNRIIFYELPFYFTLPCREKAFLSWVH